MWDIRIVSLATGQLIDESFGMDGAFLAGCFRGIRIVIERGGIRCGIIATRSRS